MRKHLPSFCLTAVALVGALFLWGSQGCSGKSTKKPRHDEAFYKGRYLYYQDIIRKPCIFDPARLQPEDLTVRFPDSEDDSARVRITPKDPMAAYPDVVLRAIRSSTSTISLESCGYGTPGIPGTRMVLDMDGKLIEYYQSVYLVVLRSYRLWKNLGLLSTAAGLPPCEISERAQIVIEELFPTDAQYIVLGELRHKVEWPTADGRPGSAGTDYHFIDVRDWGKRGTVVSIAMNRLDGSVIEVQIDRDLDLKKLRTLDRDAMQALKKRGEW